MILSPQQIASYAAGAGFSGNDLVIAVAIALAESGGNTSIPGDQTLAPLNGPSLGLWQINIGQKANPQYASWNLYDPATNATAAFQVYQRQGFHGWTTYGNGKYQQYLGVVAQALGGQSPPAAPDYSLPSASFVSLPEFSSDGTIDTTPADSNIGMYVLGAAAVLGLVIALEW